MFSRFYQKLSGSFIHWLTSEPPSTTHSLYDYDRLRHEVRPGDVLLIEGRSRVSDAIRTITQSSWTHAALYIGRFHDIEDRELKKTVRRHLEKRENVRLVVEAVLGKGGIVTPLSHYRDSHIRICRPNGLSPDDAQLVIAHAINALGKPYSVRRLLDLARFILPWSILPRRWGSSLFRTSTGEIESGICSSLIAESFSSVQFPILPLIQSEEDGVRIIKRNPHLYTPRDFDYSPYFDIIKCPALNPEEERPYYRRMPWVSNAVHNDHGRVNEPSPPKDPSDRMLNHLLKRIKKKSEGTTPIPTFDETDEKNDRNDKEDDDDDQKQEKFP